MSPNRITPLSLVVLFWPRVFSKTFKPGQTLLLRARKKPPKDRLTIAAEDEEEDFPEEEAGLKGLAINIH